LQPVVLEWLVFAKIAGQWVASVLPILLVSPLLAMAANLSGAQMAQALWLLVLASPTVVALGSIASALTLGARRGGLLQALVVMPLYVPVLIFAASAGEHGALLFLTGMMLGSVPLACFVSAALIRISQD
ncbi:MAG: heme exporter protein CcmB, partial [Rickettsiales bacterium]|nr:heme exporter protein CcmB [Rickettsiales bacterium]